jgi:hypothetical protein
MPSADRRPSNQDRWRMNCQIIYFSKDRRPSRTEENITGVRGGCFNSRGTGTRVVVAQGKPVEGAAEGIY